MTKKNNYDEIRQRWTSEQHALAAQVCVQDDDWTDRVTENEDFRLVSLRTGEDDNTFYGGVDVSFPGKETDQSVAVYVVVDQTTKQVVYKDHEYFDLEMPYIPTFLGFREIEPLERLIKKQMNEKSEMTPRAILVDGNGILHPRDAGIACFVGVRTGIPTIGIGKTLFYEGGLTRELVAQRLEESLVRAQAALPLLCGKDDKFTKEAVLFDKHTIRGALVEQDANNNVKSDSPSALIDRRVLVQSMAPYCRGLAIPMSVQRPQGETVLACALVGHGGRIHGHSKQPAGGTINPIFVSVGHGLSLREAVEITASLSECKIPSPIREADLGGRDMLRKAAAAAAAVE